VPPVYDITLFKKRGKKVHWATSILYSLIKKWKMSGVQIHVYIHFPLLFLRKMSHGSAIFQVKDKCISLVEINLIIQKRNMDFPYDYVLLKIKIWSYWCLLHFLDIVPLSRFTAHLLPVYRATYKWTSGGILSTT
jgi:hypothetical protein